MHKSNGGLLFWEIQKEKIIHMYLEERRSSNYIAKVYDCNPSTILRYLKYWGIPIRKSRYNSVYSIDENFFSNIDREGKAYVVGVLLAGGHLSKKGVLMLTMSDFDIVEKYRDAIGSNAPIKTDRYGNYANRYAKI